MQTDKSEQLENQDWSNIYKRLVHYTYKLVFYRYPQFKVHPGSQNLALGVTCEDIAQIAIEKVISGQRIWPDGLDLFVVLKQVVRSELSNLATKRASKEELLLLDDDFYTNEPVQPMDHPEDNYYEEHWKIIREAANGDDELQYLIFAMEHLLNLNENPTRNNLAVILDLAPQEVTNLRRRLDRHVRKVNEKLKSP